MVEQSTLLCHKLMDLNQDYQELSAKTTSMVNEVDSSLAYFDMELLSRLKKTASLIQTIQKNPMPQKMTQLKQALAQKKNEKLLYNEEEFD